MLNFKKFFVVSFISIMWVLAFNANTSNSHGLSISYNVVSKILMVKKTTIQEFIVTKILEQDEIQKKLLELAKNILMLHEGYSGTPYLCNSGKWTIGHGKLVSKKPQTNTNKQLAEQWLISDIDKIVVQLDETLPWWKTLDNVRQTALINLTYNMGIDKLLKFENMLTSLKNGDYIEAGNHLLKGKYKGKSLYSIQVGKRALYVAEALKYGIWNTDKMRLHYG